jgi:hypothetical protein
MLARPLILLLVLGATACAGSTVVPDRPPAKGPEDATSVVKLGGGEGAFDPDDRDGDGIPDAYDLCPAHAEDGKGAHPFDGCPDERDPSKRVVAWGPSPKQAVKVTRGEIKISEEIRFGLGSATIDPSSQALLKSIAQILRDVPEIELVEIAGHADASGGDDANKKLTAARAASVRADLIQKGTAADRLRAAGYSSYCALDPGTTDAARARNRRVELRILRRDGANLGPTWGGCAEAEKHGLRPAPLPAPRAPVAPADDRRARECPEGEARQCGARCDKGDVAACESLANLYGADDPRRALAAARKACDLGALHFCLRVAGDLRQGKGTPRDLPRAHEMLQKACGKGHGLSCTAAGVDLRKGEGAPRDEARAAELFQRGCEDGDGGGCQELGASFWEGRGVPKDRRRAFEMYIAGCEAGSGGACAAIGAAFKEDAASAARSRARALAALHVGCEQDEAAPACEALRGLDEQPGEYTVLPVCAAGDFKACREACRSSKAGAACVDFGLALLYGTGVRRRSADAGATFAEACREGNARGCALSAVVHAGNNEDPRAERTAAADFEAACASGEPSGCVNHALMELDGLGTYKDEESAARELGALCEKGVVALACAHAAALARRGVGAPADPARARVLAERACAGGFRRACADQRGEAAPR